MAPELDREFESASGTVRWTSFGTGPPVVFSHGTPWSSYVWRDIATVVSEKHTVYLWDMPGYGSSAMYDSQDVSLGAQGQVFAALLKHWKLDGSGAGSNTDDKNNLSLPLVIVHDFGGAVAFRAHLLHGARYRGLMVVDPVALAPWGSPFFSLVSENATVFEQLPAFLHRALVREYISSASSPGLHPQTLDGLAAPWVNRGEEGQAGFYRQIAQASQRYTDEVQTRYGEITMPVFVCWGTEDTWIPIAKAHELVSLIPGATLKTIPGAGHLVQEDAPVPLTAAVLEFLAGF